MSQVFPRQGKRWLSDFSIGQVVATIVAAFVLSMVGGAVSVWVTQARTTDRIDGVVSKQEETDRRVEANKQERELQIKDLRDHTITRGEFDTYKEIVKEIRDDVREIRSAQLQQQNR